MQEGEIVLNIPDSERSPDKLYMRGMRSGDSIFYDTVSNIMVKHILREMNDGVRKELRDLLVLLNTDNSSDEKFNPVREFIKKYTLKNYVGEDSINYTFINNSDDSSLFQIVYNVLSDIQVLKEFIEDDQDIDVLRGFAEDNLLSFATGTISLGNFSQESRVLSPKSINPITVWYAKNAYFSLEKTLAKLSEQDSGEKRIESLAILGYLLGYLDENHPNSNENRQLLYRYLNGELPKVVRDLISSKENISLDSDRLTMLKGFWHEAFILKWMTSSRLSSHGSKSLSPYDQKSARSQMIVDGRQASTRGGANNIAMKVLKSGGSNADADRVLFNFDREQARIALEEDKARIKLNKYIQKLITLYNPENKYFADRKELLASKWEELQKKTGRILHVFSTVGSRLTNSEVTKTGKQSVLHLLSKELKEVINSGNGDLSIEDLFGSDFDSFHPIEQCSLIVFTCLVIAKSRHRPEHAVHLVSHELQAMLADYSDFISDDEDDEVIINDDNSNWRFSIDEMQDDVDGARERLNELSPSDEIISSENEDLKQEFDLLYGKMEALGRLVESIKIDKSKDRHFALMNVISIIYLLGNYIDNASIAEIPFLVIFFNFIIWQLRDNLNKAKWDTLSSYREINITSDNLDEDIERVEDLHRKEIFRFLKTIFIQIGVSFTAIFILGIVSNIHIKEVPSWFPDLPDVPGLNLLKIEIPLDSGIPDQINQESLRNMTHKLRGEVFHLPENFTGEYGEGISFLSDVWRNNDGSVFIDSNITLFDQFEYVNDSIFENGINESTHYAQDNQLVYEVEDIYDIVYLLEGYKLAKIYQAGGEQPSIGDSGNIYYPGGDTPDRLMLVLEPISSKILSPNGEVRQFDGVKGVIYHPWVGWNEYAHQQSLDLNSKLQGDPLLQKLHMEMIIEADDLVQKFGTEIDYDEMAVSYSDLATKYSILFGEYVNSNRHYSLLYERDGASNLESIANQPGAGYYCSVGNLSYQEFMSSMGINVLAKTGAGVRNYDGKLLSRIGHLNSVLLLPNGEALFVDMTPIRSNPGEDLSALNDVAPDGSLLDNMGLTPNMLAMMASLGFIGLMGVEAVKMRNRPIETKIDKMMREGKIGAEIVLKAVDQIMMSVVEISDEDRARSLIDNSFHKNRKEFLISLAHDAVLMISEENTTTLWSDSIKKALIGQASDLKGEEEDELLAEEGLQEKAVVVEDEVNSEVISKAVNHVKMYLVEIFDEDRAKLFIDNGFYQDRESFLRSLVSDAMRMVPNTLSSLSALEVGIVSILETSKEINLDDHEFVLAEIVRMKKDTVDVVEVEKVEVISNKVGLNQISKESRTTISHNLGFIRKEIKKQKNEKIIEIGSKIKVLEQEVVKLKKERQAEEKIVYDIEEYKERTEERNRIRVHYDDELVKIRRKISAHEKVITNTGKRYPHLMSLLMSMKKASG